MPVSDYTPTVQQVAANIMSRTRNQYGALAGTFDANTTPTDTQVQAIVGAIINEIADEIGDNIPQDLFDDAAQVAARRAAMQVELDFFSEQVNTGRSIYPQLKEQYERALTALKRQVTMAEEGETGVVDSGATGHASWSFPPAQPWQTRVW